MPARFQGRSIYRNRKYTYSSYVFHDDSLVSLTIGGVIGEIGTIKPAPDDRFGFACSRDLPGAPHQASEYLLVPLLPVLLPFALLNAALDTATDSTAMRARAFAGIRFGGPLPGGPAAFAADHPDVVRLLRQEDADADLAIELYDYGDPKDPEKQPNFIILEIRDDLLTRVKARLHQGCRLMPDKSIVCDSAKLP